MRIQKRGCQLREPWSWTEKDQNLQRQTERAAAPPPLVQGGRRQNQGPPLLIFTPLSAGTYQNSQLIIHVHVAGTLTGFIDWHWHHWHLFAARFYFTHRCRRELPHVVLIRYFSALYMRPHCNKKPSYSLRLCCCQNNYLQHRYIAAKVGTGGIPLILV